MLRHVSGPWLASYYGALDHWYGCGLSEDADVLSSLELMVATLTGTAAAAPPGVNPNVVAERELLRGIGTALLELLRGGGRAEAYQDLIGPAVESVPQVLRQATDMAIPVGLLSVPFLAGFQRYAEVDDTIRRTSVSQIPVRDKIDRLAACLDQLGQGRRLILAPHHQERILDALYHHAITETRDLVQRLRGGASLEVQLTTGSVAADQDDSGVILSVANVGSVEARDVEVELAASAAFELLDQSFRQTLPALAPDGEHPFRFSIRPLTGDDAFRIRCTVSCSDPGRTRQQRTVEFGIRVVGIDSGPFRQKQNPYVFGVHLEEHRQFYGRRNELAELLGHLADRRPQNMLLRGARRTGKTSLLYMVRAALSDRGGRTGVRSWFALPESWHPALDSTVPVMLNLQGVDVLRDNPTPTGFYHAVLGALRDGGLSCPFSQQLLDDPVVAATQFVKALRDIVQGGHGLRPVMLVDEFDVLDKMADKSLYAYFRTAIASVQGITWIVASALGLYNEVRDYESPLFNVFKIVSMVQLEHEAARRLVLDPWDRVPADGSRLRFADDAVESILEAAGRNPYFIQLLCSEVVGYANAARSNYVQYTTVVQAIDRRILTDSGAASEHFAYLWDRAGNMGKLILLTLLHNPLAMGHEELREEMVRLLRGHLGVVAEPASLRGFEDHLQRLTIVDAIRLGPGGYSFGIPLFRRLLLKRAERGDLERTTAFALAAELTGGRGR
jgi:AAA ATPase domain